MDTKHTAQIRKIINQKGFTLVELIVVVAIIGILTAIGSTYFTYLKFRSGDSQAYVEGRQLFTAVNDAFLNLEDINFGDGTSDISGPIGGTTIDGNSRQPIFTLSSEIRARLDGESTSSPGGGFLTAEVYSINGTNDDDGINGKKTYTYVIDEDAYVISVPNF